LYLPKVVPAMPARSRPHLSTLGDAHPWNGPRFGGGLKVPGPHTQRNRGPALRSGGAATDPGRVSPLALTVRRSSLQALFALLILCLSPGCGCGPEPSEPPPPVPGDESTSAAETSTPAAGGRVEGVLRAAPDASFPSVNTESVVGCPPARPGPRLGPERELADAVVLLRRAPRPAGAPPTPARVAETADHAMRLTGCLAEPAALVVHVGDRLVVHNEDDRYHALGLSELDGGQERRVQTLPLAPKERDVSLSLAQPGLLRLSSDQVPWLDGLVLVLRPDESGAVTAADGSFSVADLPAGSWNASVRHPLLGERRTTVEVVEGEVAALIQDLGGSVSEE
jgi:hypothetical protein